MDEQRERLRPRETRGEKRERMDERRGERKDERLRMELREGRREKRARMEDWRNERREERWRIEWRGVRREKGGRIMEELRGEERDERQRIKMRRERRKSMEEWRNGGRERRQNADSRCHIRDKRDRTDELVRDHKREKRPRLDGETEDRERYQAELDFVKRRRERSREKHRERFRDRPGSRPRERPISISDLNRIYGRLSIDREEDQRKGFSQVFKYMENVNGKRINILEGLKLHTNVFDPLEQARITDFVYEMQNLGQEGQLKEHTYTAPTKWMRGKGRVTLQFGCCYNYAKDKEGNLPGIMRNGQVDPLPPLLKDMIRRLVNRQILPKTCAPDSCIINIYEKGDCIPPHIDHKDFLRPFCTVSFLSDADILFGRNLKVAGPGEFFGSTSISLPCGSVLVLSGNGADLAKHCVPGVSSKRISITFRKMVHEKLPYQHQPDPDLNFV